MGWDITFAQLPVLRSGHRHTLIMGQQPLSQIRNRTSAATCVYFTGGILAPPHVDGLAISYPVKLAWRTRTEPRHSRRKQPSSTSGNTARPASWLVNSFSSGFGPAHARLPHQGRKQKARRRMLPPDAMNSLRCRHQQISSLPVGQRVAGWLAVPRAAGIASCWFQLILRSGHALSSALEYSSNRFPNKILRSCAHVRTLVPERGVRCPYTQSEIKIHVPHILLSFNFISRR
jgi:hypothetical protein